MNIIIDRRRLLVATGVLAAAGLAPARSAFAANKPLVIATSLPSMAFPWYVHMNQGYQGEAKKQGDITLIVLDGGNSASKQTADIESAITQKVDAILITPTDVDAIAPVLAQAIAAGIPVVTVDRPTNGVEGILYHVGADNVKGGEVQGHAIMDAFPQGAKIFNLQGQLGSGNAIARSKGLHNVLDPQKDKYKFVFEQTANFSQSEALNVTEGGLSGQGKPDVIVCGNDDMALGAVGGAAGAQHEWRRRLRLRRDSRGPGGDQERRHAGDHRTVARDAVREGNERRGRLPARRQEARHGG